MRQGMLGEVWWRAGENEPFRYSLLQNPGIALAEEGFILTDEEMSELRSRWEELAPLNPRAALERIQALARSWRRE